MSQRLERVDELLRQEIGALLTRDVHDPHIGFVTVTDVETTPDLRHATVWISVIGDDTARRDALRAFDRATGFLRRELGVRLRIKRIPDLHVRLDDSAERGTRVMQVLDALREGDVEAGEAVADAPHRETLPTPIARAGRPGDAVEPGVGDGDDGAAGPDAAKGRPGLHGHIQGRAARTRRDERRPRRQPGTRPPGTDHGRAGKGR